MFCANCGTHVQDGVHFCGNCGAALQASGGISQQAPVSQPPMGTSVRSTKRASKQPDPYQAQIKQLKLEIRQLKLDLKQITSKMSNIRSGYNETSAFVPHGFLKHGYKEIEDMRLLGSQQQKQQLQQQIMQLEQQLLGLQQMQTQWQAQQG
ncbi:MAG: zinc ribbon domain-containing protein [Ktedonobacteraceae bacterium]